MADLLGSELSVLSEVQRMLAQAKDVHEVKDLRDKAEALRKYAKDARLGLDLQNQAAEAKLRAERKAGKMLAAMCKATGARGIGKKVELHDATPLLSELGIEKTQSHRWQRMASIPDADFDGFVQQAHQERRELTAAALLRLEKRKTAVKAGDSTTKPNLTPATAYVSDFDRLLEANQQCQLLATLLEPVLRSDATVLSNAERRMAARVLDELSVHLQTLLEIRSGGCR